MPDGAAHRALTATPGRRPGWGIRRLVRGRELLDGGLEHDAQRRELLIRRPSPHHLQLDGRGLRAGCRRRAAGRVTTGTTACACCAAAGRPARSSAGCVIRTAGRVPVPVTREPDHGYSGMFPCFLAGMVARFVLSARSAFTTATRVAAGSITPSSSPRSAARNGLATL